MNGIDALVYSAKQLKKGEKQTLTNFDKKYVNIVDYILSITHDIWENKGIGELYNTYAEDITLHMGLFTHSGRDAVISGTLKTLQTFPDRVPYGEEVIWSEAKGDKFFSSHRLGSTATHLGHSVAYGAPTGRKIFLRGIADCIIANNIIEEEWLVRDNYYILEQLGCDPLELAKESHHYNFNFEVEDQRVVREENAITPCNIASCEFTNNTRGSSIDLVVDLFTELWHKHYFNRVEQYYAENAVLHSIREKQYCGTGQIRDYFVAFFSSIPNADIFIERITCNTGKTGDKVAVRWTITGVHCNYGVFGAPSEKIIHVVGITHFQVVDGKIQEEWSVFDMFDVLCQIYALPAHPKTRHTLLHTADANTRNKKTVLSYINAFNRDIARTDAVPMGIVAAHMSDDVVLHASKPFHEIHGVQAYCTQFLQPLYHAFPDIEDTPYIVMGGTYKEKQCVSIAGNFLGSFEHSWLGIPPSYQLASIRYQAHFVLEHGKITRAWYLLDVLDLIHQAGFDIFPSRGAAYMVGTPMTCDGIITYPVEKTESKKTLNITLAMLDALCRYDGKDPTSMGDLSQYWNAKEMMWYSPAGIGTTRGLAGFQNYHQFPYLTAFPNRGIMTKNTENYFASYAEGNYACDFGFPSMYATHTGDGWLGLKATGIACTMRVMDFWRREGNLLKENWVMIDIIDVLEQLGVDVFDMLHKRINGSATVAKVKKHGGVF